MSATADAPTAAQQSSAPARQQWIDLARGGCVLLVVLYHVVIWHLGQLAPAPGLRLAVWQQLNDVAGGVRMPVLLLLSGSLAARKVARGRPALRAAAADYWLYLVWLSVFALVLPWLAVPRVGHVAPGASWLRQLVLPGTALWYVFALAVYLVVCVATRRLPGWLVVAAAVLLAVGVEAGPVIWLKVPELFCWFALGVHAGGRLRAELAVRRWPLAAVGTVLFVAGGWLAGRCTATGWPQRASFLVGNLGKALLVLVAAFWLARVPLLGEGLAWLGRHTLPVYTMHPLLVAGWMSLVSRAGWDSTLLTGRGAAAVAYPLVLVLAITTICLGLERALRPVLPALFALPRRCQEALTRWSGQPGSDGH